MVKYSRATGYGELPVPEPECCRFRNQSAAGYRLLVTEKSAVPIITGRKSSADNRFTGYRGLQSYRELRVTS